VKVSERKEPMIYLVGLNHKYQLEGYEDNWVHFYEFVSKKAKTLDADLLVEEMSEDGLKLYNTRNSVMSRVANEQNRRHFFIDPVPMNENISV
jgi:hypothetical protein